VSSPPLATPTAASPADTQPIALVDLLDRLLGTGVVIAGDVVISLAGVDLVELRLRALLRTVQEDS
jgi:gas vesicle protein GvpA/GvpJ/GvpM family